MPRRIPLSRRSHVTGFQALRSWRQRLTAFAALKAGATVGEAAAIARVQPMSVYRWLDRGIEHGLEAALERHREARSDVGSIRSTRAMDPCRPRQPSRRTS